MRQYFGQATQEPSEAAYWLEAQVIAFAANSEEAMRMTEISLIFIDIYMIIK